MRQVLRWTCCAGAFLAFLATRLDDDEQHALLFHGPHCILSTLPS